MKKKTKGYLAFAFLGGIMITSGVVIAIPGLAPEDPDEAMTITGTPADNFPDVQRSQFCSSGQPKSNSYIKEFRIPTDCTQPLAIVADPQGDIWFAQTNTGKIAKFNPQTETFTEYDNQVWPKGSRSMIWGMDYSPDGSIWYTDEFYDSVWKFSIEDNTYNRLDFPTQTDSLPQKLEVQGSQIIVNDFTGNKISFLDPVKTDTDVGYFSLPSPVENSFTSDFAVDQDGNVWYTNWAFQQGGVLVKFDQDAYVASSSNIEGDAVPLFEHLDVFSLPPDLTTPNGAVVDYRGRIWLADTSSSFFFSFDPVTEIFTKYVTSDPSIETYGNSSGLIKTPVTRPYWIELDQNQNLIFNEQTGNRIAIFDPRSEKLVEYNIPSKNPDWADCENLNDCGISQVFGIAPIGDKVWFTEWVENNIGVLDTSVPLPVDVAVDKQMISVKKGEMTTLTMTLSALQSKTFEIISKDTSFLNDLVVTPEITETSVLGGENKSVQFSISASDNPINTKHKLLVGAQTDEVIVSKYVTIEIVP